MFNSAGGSSSGRNRNYYGNLRTLSTRSNLKSASQIFHPLPNASEAESMSAGWLDELGEFLRRDTFTLVFDHQYDGVN